MTRPRLVCPLAARPLERRAASGNDGYTLIEMLVVMVILALLAGVVGLGAVRAHREPDTGAVAEDVRSMLARARGAAVSGSRRVEVTLDLRQKRISREGDREIVTLPAEMQATLLVGLELVRADRVATLLFLPDGGSSGAELHLADGRGEAVVRVPWLTGIPSLATGD